MRGAEHEHIEHPFPGTEFLTSRSVIMRTKVFNLLHKVRSGCFCPKSGNCPERGWWLEMPKGALLHAHLDATIDVNFMLNRILEQEALYVRTPAPLTALSPTANVIPEISPFPKSEVKLSAIQSLTDASYDGEWIPVNVAREFLAGAWWTGGVREVVCRVDDYQPRRSVRNPQDYREGIYFSLYNLDLRGFAMTEFR